jgi:hypothetical protein
MTVSDFTKLIETAKFFCLNKKMRRMLARTWVEAINPAQRMNCALRILTPFPAKRLMLRDRATIGKPGRKRARLVESDEYFIERRFETAFRHIWKPTAARVMGIHNMG